MIIIITWSTVHIWIEAESNIVPQSLSIQQIEINSTILSPMITCKDPTRAEPIDEYEEYNNSFKSIKGGNVMSTACLHSRTIGQWRIHIKMQEVYH